MVFFKHLRSANLEVASLRNPMAKKNHVQPGETYCLTKMALNGEAVAPGLRYAGDNQDYWRKGCQNATIVTSVVHPNIP